MRIVSMLLAIALTASPAVAQQSQPIRASIERAAEAAAEQTASQPKPAAPARKGVLFWSGLAVGIAGATTSALGLTAFRTEDNSTGNAPSGTYLACVAQKNSSPVYATNQCDALEGQEPEIALGRRGGRRPGRRHDDRRLPHQRGAIVWRHRHFSPRELLIGLASSLGG